MSTSAARSKDLVIGKRQCFKKLTPYSLLLTPSLLLLLTLFSSLILLWQPTFVDAQGTLSCPAGQVPNAPSTGCVDSSNNIGTGADSIDPQLNPSNPLAPACEETPEAAFCQDVLDNSDVNDDDPVQDAIGLGVNILVILAMILAVFAIVYSGVRYIYSNGNEESVKTAKKTLTYAVVGVLVVLFVERILELVFSI